MRNAFVKTLLEQAEAHPEIWLLNGDLGYSVLEPFSEKFPTRYLNAGVAEQNMTGIAAGLSLVGKKVFNYSIANFPVFRCLEQIRNDVCYHNLDVKIVAVGGGFAYGSAGYTHFAVEDLGVMRTLPGMTVLSPGDPTEVEWATKFLSESHGPAYLRLARAGEKRLYEKAPRFQIGEPQIISEGSDLSVFATGAVVSKAVELAEELRSNGISTRVLSVHTLKPMKRERIAAVVAESRAVLTIEEHEITTGLGSIVGDTMAEFGLVRPFQKIGIQELNFSRVGSQQFWWESFGNLYQKAIDLLNRGSIKYGKS